MDEDKRIVAERSRESSTDATASIDETPAQEPLVWPKLRVGQEILIEGFPFVIARRNAGSVVVRPVVPEMTVRRVLRRLFRL